MIRIKRVYDPADPADGPRFLVDRLWPRGMKKENLPMDGWLKEVAPSDELRRWFGHDPARWDEFRKRYSSELKGKADEWRFLLAEAQRGTVTLLYGAHDLEHNNAVALKKFLDNHSKENKNMKILMILTSHDTLGNTGKKTGFWLEEFAAPYYVFKDAGAEIVLASPKGGQPPLDPKSDEKDFQTAATERFRADKEAQDALAHTKILRDLCADDYDAVFYPGGHGPLWDLAEDRNSIALIEAMYAQGKPVSAVCHAPGVLRHARSADGSPLVQGKSVTGFSNSEEAAVGLTEVVPFLVEDELRNKGGKYAKGPDWQSFSTEDGNLITGQNPASSEAVAQAVLKKL